MFNIDLEKVSYCFGVNIAQNMKQQGMNELSAEFLAKGLEDFLKGANLEIPEDQIQNILQTYFKEQTGTGVLSTADQEGHVNAAVYARPHCFDDGTVGFIMPDRLTHQNLTTNGHAVYLFHQDTNGNDERRFSVGSP